MSNILQPDWPAPANIVALSTLRTDGFSRQPYDSFNLGLHVGDTEQDVRRNRVLLLQLAGVERCNWLTQVHGSDVVEAGVAGVGLDADPEADALWSRTQGEACAVLTADCLPVLLCSVDGEVVAAAHAGWRGMLAGVLEATVEQMDAPAENVLAWLGPAIGPQAFEVGPEVQAAFIAEGPAALQRDIATCFLPSQIKPGKHFADLYALGRLRLASVGVKRIYGGSYCTYSDAEKFFSYRRDGRTGRMASLIAIRSRL